MKIQVTVNTSVDMGDHGREVINAIDCNENITIKELCEKCLVTRYDKRLNPNDHIEIRICKDI